MESVKLILYTLRHKVMKLLSAHRSRRTFAYLHSQIPEIIESENWLPNSLELNAVNFSMWGASGQKLYRYSLSTPPTLMRQDCLVLFVSAV